MFCNLCPFIVWFSTAFRLVVDQLNMAASSAQLWQSTNLHMTGQMDNWTIGQLDGWTNGLGLRSICGQLLAFKNVSRTQEF